MSNKLFSDSILDTAVCDFLPKEVMFSMGERGRVECASLWINRLQKDVETLKAERDRFKAIALELVGDIETSTDHAPWCPEGSDIDLCACMDRRAYSPINLINKTRTKLKELERAE